MNNKIKHLEMIQSIITRMGGNLFILKGWSITLIVALFAILAKEINGVYSLFAFCVLFIFWLLDGFFLSIERCFKDLYDETRLKNENDIDFSMNYKKHKNGRNTWIKSMFSTTLLIFYGTLLVVMIIVVIFSNINNFKLNFSVGWTNNIKTTTSIGSLCEQIKK